MLLAFDVGNTDIVLGVFRGGGLVQSWYIETARHRTADEYGMMINQLFDFEKLELSDVSDVIISTVVPSVLFSLQQMSEKYIGKHTMVVGPGIKTGLRIVYDDPAQVGADRIVNAVAALAKYGGPVIVIDFGTATTFCACTKDWRYIGGSIAPGLRISADALFEKTAKLPRVELEAPSSVICKNTIEGMQSGLVFGHRGTVEYIATRMKKELAEADGSGEPVRVIATGGLAGLMGTGLDCIDKVDKLLTLEGLYYIYEKNKKEV